MEPDSYNHCVGCNLSTPLPEDGYEDIISAAHFINRYYLWGIVILGIPGNTAAIWTIFRMRHLGSFAFYVVLLAVVDNLALVIKILSYQLIAAQVNIYDAGCKFISYFANFLITFANWILVLMAVERLLAVKFPLKIQCFNIKNSVIAACCVGVILSLSYLPILWYMSYDDGSGCIFNSPYLLAVSLHWAHRLLYGYVPFVILLVSNFLIARVIQNSFQRRHAMQNLTTSNLPDVPHQRQIMTMLFTTTCVFVLFTFPICLFNLAEIYWKVTLKTKEDAIKYLLQQIAYVMCDSNHAINFYLYFLSARKFRSQIVRNSVLNSSQRGRMARLNGGNINLNLKN